MEPETLLPVVDSDEGEPGAELEPGTTTLEVDVRSPLLEVGTQAESVQVTTAVLVCVTIETMSEVKTEVMLPEVMVWPAGQVVVLVYT